MKRAGIFLLALLWLASLVGAAERAQTKIRTITAFVPLAAATAESTFREAAEFLRQAKRRFEAAGWEVQSLRLATPPMNVYLKDVPEAERLDFLLRLDRLGAELGLELSLGPAMVHGREDVATEDLVVELLKRSRVAHTSVDITSPTPFTTFQAATIIKRLGEVRNPEPPSFRFAALARCPPGIPFFPAAYARGERREFALGLQSAGFLAQAFVEDADAGGWLQVQTEFTQQLKRLEGVALAIAREQPWHYLGIDVSPAPLGDASIAAVIEGLAGQPIGGPGTLAAVAELTATLRQEPVRHTGFSGLMLPVLEDKILAERAAEGRLRLHTLLVYSAVSGTGLDVVPLAGDTTEKQIVQLLDDVAALANKFSKPLTARLLLVPGKEAGEMTEFNSPWLTNTRVLPIE
ncbi:MAG: DUF711 family protein [Terriglobia bacterium]